MAYNKAPEKTYSLRGKVTKVYEPREIVLSYGGKKVVKEVSDLYLQLEAGAKVKVSFWDTDISHHENAVITITGLVFKGKYKDIPQYSSTKATQISVAKKGNSGPVEPEEDKPEGAVPEEEPTFGSDGAPEEVPEGATEEVEEAAVPEETPVAEPVKAKVKPAPKPKVVAAPKVMAPLSSVSAKSINAVTDLAIAAKFVADTIATDVVKENGQAYQALFATIFIALGKAN